jgi:hypothetical protein
VILVVFPSILLGLIRQFFGEFERRKLNPAIRS